MALDPNVFRSSPETITLVVLAILVPTLAGLFSGNIKTLAGAGLCSAVLLLVARVTSGIEIRWYAMAWILFVILAFNWFYEHRFKRA
jgi:ABC-type antimicrobial peptide transport system permease subunit